MLFWHCSVNLKATVASWSSADTSSLWLKLTTCQFLNKQHCVWPLLWHLVFFNSTSLCETLLFKKARYPDVNATPGISFVFIVCVTVFSQECRTSPSFVSMTAESWTLNRTTNLSRATNNYHTSARRVSTPLERKPQVSKLPPALSVSSESYKYY